MPQKVRAASCVLNSLSHHKHCGIWITDSLLAETWHTFCLSLRRHGSNVPGPLEARRRASRRKNTSLAYIGNGGHVAFDPAVIFGTAPQNQWWNNIAEKALADTSPQGTPIGEQNEVGRATPFPFCWQPSQTLQIPSITETPTGNTNIEVSNKTSRFGSMEDTEIKCKTYIRKARDPETLRRIIRVKKLDFREHVSLCQYAFEHLIKCHSQTSGYNKLGEVLYDPILSPTGSNNSLTLFQHLYANQISRKQWDHLFPAFLKALKLGFVLPKSLEKIIQLLPNILNKMSMEPSVDKAHSEWHRIISAIEQSKVFSLDDLDSTFLLTWYQQIADSTQTDAAFTLMWRLRQYSGLSDIDLALKLVMSRLENFTKIDREASEVFVNLLANFPGTVQGAVIVQGTFRLIAEAKSDKSSSNADLRKWSLMLPFLCPEKLQYLSIDKLTWTQATVNAHGLTSAQQILASVWCVTRLWARCPEAAARFADMNFKNEFEDTFSKVEDLHDFDYVSRVVLTLDTLPLPDKDQMFPILEHFSRQNLIKMLVDKEYLNGLKACTSLDYSRLQDNAFDFNARHRFPQLLRVLAESINQDLRQFQVMAQILILKSKHNFRIIRRLLEYNMEMKFAVSQSWPTRVTRYTTKDLESGLDPAAVLEMLEKLTMTFAITPVNDLRASFRHVYKMYQLLHKWGAPINPIIARALWHSGVTRYKQVGAPKAQVNWCLSKVRAIEGPEAANRLLWSPAFRDSFVQDFVRSLYDTAVLPEFLELSGQATNTLQGTPEPLQPKRKALSERTPVRHTCSGTSGKSKAIKVKARDETWKQSTKGN